MRRTGRRTWVLARFRGWMSDAILPRLYSEAMGPRGAENRETEFVECGLLGRIRSTGRALAIALSVSAALAACSEPARRYSADGIVRGLDREAGQVVIEHGDIEGFMDAMTMSFDVDDTVLEGLVEGQIIDFVVIFDGRSYRVDEIVVTGIAFSGAGESGIEKLVDVGDPAPGFELTDQDGNDVSLASLRGGPVVLDFIFTSCPGPCPILTATHVTFQRRLSPDLRARTRFVSISLDPERDTPEALRTYAEARGVDLASWSFLTGPSDRVGAVLDNYGVGSVRSENDDIEHIVVTFLIDSEGRIAYRYLGLEHGADDLVADLEGLASR